MYEHKLITATQAAQSIRITERQFFRILDRFRASGQQMASLAYQSHPAWNRSLTNLERTVLSLARDNPEALNSHLSWLAWDGYGAVVKPATVRSILLRHDQYIPFSHKKERAYKQFVATHFGALAQFDTADGYWLKGYPMIHLIIALDDATRTILAAQFVEHDSTLENMLVIKEIIQQYGVPALFYTDNDSKFRVIRHGTSSHHRYTETVLAGEAETEIRRALREVGSGLITHAPFQPQGKGKVEKVIRFIEDCFIAHHQARTLTELNTQLRRWLTWYDTRDHRTLGVAPRQVRTRLMRERKVALKPAPKNVDLDTVFALQQQRKPNKYNIFSYQGKSYQLPLEQVCYPGSVELRVLPDERIRVFKDQAFVAELHP